MNVTKSNRASRRGSAILLCYLAMAVVSVASIAIARSHRRLNMRRSVTLSSVQGRLVADGLVHRQIAYQRINPSLVLAPIDKTLADITGFEDATANIVAVDTTAETFEMEIALYKDAPVIRRLDVSYASGGTVGTPVGPLKGAPVTATPTVLIAVPAI
ncbi:hypothetical protein [Aporhodopirellula aestuarii]|uniref:Uncharacterized protein n=1 Tax=Aporhodopirellula aestuarii TaxID=2950107 RepID=A0ABT0TZ29_9BACT|nr:hypothetical protein [Aporhodopirellula aestuarii]MCM2369746.1 hypothetical protein [Aporhodopirellula aestuarii]